MTGRHVFETTQWSLVLAAGHPSSPDAEGALAELCQRYWYPVYAYVRRQGYPEDQAADLTQAFFARLLEKEYLRQVDQERGRFRAFLLAACRHFLSNERDRERAVKRGGGRLVSIDAAFAEERLRRAPSPELDPEREYLRRWALTVIAAVLAELRADLAARGKAPLFDRLKPFLTGEASTESRAQAAADLGTSEGALRVAVHRLRRRFRARLRAEVARTLDQPDEAAVRDEIRALLAALG